MQQAAEDRRVGCIRTSDLSLVLAHEQGVIPSDAAAQSVTLRARAGTRTPELSSCVSRCVYPLPRAPRCRSPWPIPTGSRPAPHRGPHRELLAVEPGCAGGEAVDPVAPHAEGGVPALIRCSSIPG